MVPEVAHKCPQSELLLGRDGCPIRQGAGAELGHFFGLAGFRSDDGGVVAKT